MTINHVRRRRSSGSLPGGGTEELALGSDAERVVFRDGAPVSPSPERSVVRWAIRMHLLRKPTAAPADDGRRRPRYQARRYECLERALMSREMDRL